jgi:hypothetical protein
MTVALDVRPALESGVALNGASNLAPGLAFEPRAAHRLRLLRYCSPARDGQDICAREFAIPSCL